MMKNLISKLFVALLVVGLVGAPVALASDDNLTKSSDRGSVRGKSKEHREEAKKALEKYRSKKSDDADARLKALIEYGDKIIAQRQKVLEEMQKRVSSGRCNKVDASAKSAIIGYINTMKSTLETQKTTIDKSATIEEVKKNIAAVFDNRVLGQFVPALNGICSSQRIIDLVNGKLATAVAELKTAGKDTAAIEAQMSTAKAAAIAAQNLFKKVAAAPGDSDAKANLSAAKTKLKEAKKALAGIRGLLETERDSSKNSDDDKPKSSDDAR